MGQDPDRVLHVGTEFEELEEVYREAWADVRRVVDVARKWETGALSDFHTVYGGANGRILEPVL